MNGICIVWPYKPIVSIYFLYKKNRISQTCHLLYVNGFHVLSKNTCLQKLLEYFFRSCFCLHENVSYYAVRTTILKYVFIKTPFAHMYYTQKSWYILVFISKGKYCVNASNIHQVLIVSVQGLASIFIIKHVNIIDR